MSAQFPVKMNETNAKSLPMELLFKNMTKLEQYAEGVTSYTSRYNSIISIAYSPDNLAGKPVHHPNYGDFPETYMLRSYGKWWNESESAQSAYMTQDTDPIIPEDYVTLKYKYAVIPTEVKIYETYNPGAVVRIWGRCFMKTWKLLWEGHPEVCARTTRCFQPPIRQINDTVNELRLDINQSLLRYHTSLDAVLLAGYQPRSELQMNLLRKGLFKPYVTKKKVISVEDSDDKEDLFAALPYEVIVHIFEYLDLKSLCRSAQVNTRWLEASLDPALYRELSLKRHWYKVTDSALQYFTKRCKNLRKLDLSWCGNENRITEDGFTKFLNKCSKHLTHLSVGYCDFIKTAAIEAISKNYELTDLRLRNCNCVCWQYTFLVSLNKLVTLDLYSSSIIDEPLIKILKLNPHLKHLILDFCEHLEKLDQVAETVAHFNKHLSTWSSWKARSMTATGVGYLSNCQKLRELDLGWCLIVSGPGDCLERIAHGCPDLRRLVISGWVDVSDHLLLPIIRSCKQLTQLDLLGIIDISGDICKRVLVSLPKLQLLEISFCENIQKEQVKNWRQDYPNVVIQRSRFVSPVLDLNYVHDLL